MKAVRIRVHNWAKYQGEAAKHDSTSWYRQQNTIWAHAIWDLLTGDEWKVKTFIDCQVSALAHKTGEVVLVLKNCVRLSGIPAEIFASAFKKLASPEAGYLEICEITEQVSETTASGPQSDLNPTTSGLQSARDPGASGSQAPLRTNGRNATDETDGASPPPDDSKIFGPVPELADVPNAKYLLEEEISHRGQRIWIDAHGLEFVRTELRAALAKYLTDDVRRAKRGLSGYLAKWFENARKGAAASAEPPPAKKSSLDAPAKCELYTMMENPEDPNEQLPVCGRIHEPGEFCEVTKRKVPGAFKPTLKHELSGRERAAGEREDSG